MHPVLCTNTHHDVTDLANHEIIKNKKVAFRQNEKILNLCPR